MSTIRQMLLALSAKTFCISAATTWNSLSDNCKRTRLLSTFRIRLKVELFHNAYQLAMHVVLSRLVTDSDHCCHTSDLTMLTDDTVVCAALFN